MKPNLIEFVPVKRCSCGKLYLFLPAEAVYFDSDGDDCFGMKGWMWDCVCRSTLFVPGAKS